MTVTFFARCEGCDAIYENPTNIRCPKCGDGRWHPEKLKNVIVNEKEELKKTDKFNQLLEQMRTIHDSKRKDYAGEDPLENFKRATIIASWFTNERDKTYATLLGIKLARLANLLSNNQAPNNESVEDTFTDGANYLLIWATGVVKK